MKESEDITIGFPEQGGDIIDVGLPDGTHLCVGGTSYGAVQILVYDPKGDIVATLDVKKMAPEEAPDVEEPYLVSVHGTGTGVESDAEVVVNGLYN